MAVWTGVRDLSCSEIIDNGLAFDVEWSESQFFDVEWHLIFEVEAVSENFCHDDVDLFHRLQVAVIDVGVDVDFRGLDLGYSSVLLDHYISRQGQQSSSHDRNLHRYSRSILSVLKLEISILAIIELMYPSTKIGYSTFFELGSTSSRHLGHIVFIEGLMHLFLFWYAWSVQSIYAHVYVWYCSFISQSKCL